MKKLLLVTTALVCAATATQAADIMEERFAGPDWTGAYVGAHGTWTESYTGSFDNGDAPPPATDYRFADDGYGYGVYAGYDWQAGPYVFGVAADYDWLHIANQERFSQTSLGKGDIYDYDLDWVASARVRGGFLLDESRMLIYGTGGAAFTAVEMTSTYDGSEIYSSSGTEHVTGKVYGGGVEYRFAPNWSFKTEYLRYDFGDVSVGGDTTTRITFEPVLEQVRMGIAYRF